jgi:cytochrome oxidase Cu insertion factor (SCO1/SenC/PrrC family)
MRCIRKLDEMAMKAVFHMEALLQVAIVGLLLWQVTPARAASADYDRLDKGPKVGAAIPLPLAATDQSGKARDFASLKGTHGLILLFARSLNW